VERLTLFGSRARGDARPDSDLDLLVILHGNLTPEREKQWRRQVRDLRLALRHEQSLAASLDLAFAQENWGFLAQQCVENLLNGLIVLADQQPPLSHDPARLQLLAGAKLPEELLELQEFAVKARDSPESTPLPASRLMALAQGHLSQDRDMRRVAALVSC